MFCRKLKKRIAQLEANAESDAKKIANAQQTYENQKKMWVSENDDLKKKLNEAMEVITLNAEAAENVQSNTAQLTAMVAECNKTNKELEGQAVALQSTIHAKEHNIVILQGKIEELVRDKKMLQSRVMALREMHLSAETQLSIFKSAVTTIAKKQSEKKKAAKKTSKKVGVMNIAPVRGEEKVSESEIAYRRTGSGGMKAVTPAELKGKRKYVRKNPTNKGSK
jgi:chromosome segregation ATPase